MTTESIIAQIDIARQELLDLTLRNTLLNYRLLRARAWRRSTLIPAPCMTYWSDRAERIPSYQHPILVPTNLPRHELDVQSCVYRLWRILTD